MGSILSAGTNKAKVIIIEDDRDIVTLIRYNLEKEGIGVIQAYDGREGLSALKENTVDAVILDIMLPGMDGYEFLEAVKQEPSLSGIPVVIISAKINPGAIIKGFRLGAVDYIPKPFNLGELVLKIKDILDSAETGEEVKV